MGSITAQSMIESKNPHVIGNLIGHIKKVELRNLGYKLIEYADSLVEKDTPVLAQHFYYSARGSYYYRWRDIDSFALDNAVDSFEKQIAIAEEAALCFLKDPEMGFIPAHAGYRQLRIIEEKRGRLTKARALCLKAESQGWKDDWQKQINKIDKKLSKS